MSKTTVKGTKKLTTGNSDTNSIHFLVDRAIRSTVNTAEVVVINKADQTGTDDPAGYATVTPLVCQIDAYDNVLPSASIHKLPYFRPQAGKAAIVMDPQPGDKAILVAMKRDSSIVKTGTKKPVQPGSFREFDYADGYLINGFLGEEPEIWLHLNPVSGDISLSTKEANIDISCRESGDIDISTKAGNIGVHCLESGDIEVAAKAGNITIKTESGNTQEEATGTITKKCPKIILDGNVHITGNLAIDGLAGGLNGGPAVFSSGIINQSGGISSAGGFTNTGGFNNSGGIANIGGFNNEGGILKSNNVTLEGHIHNGVFPGGFQSGGPAQGT